MATVARKANTLIVKDTLFATAQVGGWKIALDAALTEDTASAGIVTPGTARALAEELGSTAMLFEVTTNKKDIIIIGDSHALDAATLKARAEQVTGATATVTALTSLVGVTATS